MQLQTASRKRAKIKMGLQGPSGSGKTYSALLLAFGLCGDWNKIAVIDTENHSSELYEHLGKYQVLHLEMPFFPERYVEAIIYCEKAGIEVIIIDSISHEWDGVGGILAIHGCMPGNSYINWNKLTPRHHLFVQHILQSQAHFICTIRSKQDYIISERNGKQVPEKIGMKGITRDGLDYEFTLVFELNMRNMASTTKDRTSLYFGKSEFIITSETGKAIADWCNSPSIIEPTNAETLKRINSCKSLGELLLLYNTIPALQEKMSVEFTKKRLELSPIAKSDLKPQNYSANGSSKTN